MITNPEARKEDYLIMKITIEWLSHRLAIKKTIINKENGPFDQKHQFLLSPTVRGCILFHLGQFSLWGYSTTKDLLYKDDV